jgi:alcohol dehydrogenase class IV
MHVNAWWGPRADPINAALAAEGLRALRRALPVMKAGARDPAGHEHAPCGALDGLHSLREALGTPAALKDYGFAESDTPEAGHSGIKPAHRHQRKSRGVTARRP